MSTVPASLHLGPRHPALAFLGAACVPLFLGAALSDYAYTASFQVQWINFAAWLLAGGLVFAGAALVWVGVDLLRGRRSRGHVAMALLLLALCVLGFIDSLVHARDAWASMPTGLALSVVVAVLACVASWLAFAGVRAGGPA